MNTLYVNNLNHKLKDSELKTHLQSAFDRFGNILQVHSCRRFHLRGQAWIVFDDSASAQKALDEMQGTDFFGRPMRIAFSKAKSDPISKRDGTFKAREKKKYVHPGPIKGAALKRLKLAQEREEREREEELKRLENAKPITAIPRPLKPLPPNTILIAEELPAECDKSMLESLFGGYAGLKDVRVIPTKRVAFIEFDTERQASAALHTLANHQISETHLLFLNYALR